MVEHGIERVGIRFSPSLQMQRIEWALDVLRREGVKSVLDLGCGEGDLLSVLCEPAATVPEEPIRAVSQSADADGEEDMDKKEDHNTNRTETRELFLHVSLFPISPLTYLIRSPSESPASTSTQQSSPKPSKPSLLPRIPSRKITSSPRRT